ncbi:hypothetical protein LJR219_002591 [Phenylobacterium sp. LjRoot219]|uniref:hypothetical protein n=1 Tax=Phenylobacterium sp. LjRoot219 TaxID=3342283 RepID=UPI003ECF672D
MARRHELAAGAFAAILLAAGGGAALAQARDPSANYDTRDVLHRLPHGVYQLPTKEAAQGRPVTFELSLAGTYATNAGASRFDAIDTGYLTPGFGVDVTPVTLAGWDLGGGALIDADLYTGDYDDAFGEGRLEGFVFAEHPLGPGRLIAEAVLLGVFDNDFSDQAFRLLISNLTYSLSRGGMNADVAAEYQDADVPELRRTRLTTTLAYTLPEPQLGYDITVEGDLAFSDFNGGANSNRNDTVAALVLIAERELARGWSLGWEAAVLNSFSNRKSSRFTALDLVFELGKRF